MRGRFLTLMVLLLTLLAACGQDQITADEIVKRLQETQQKTTDLHVVVDLSLTSPQQSGTGAVELWTKRNGTNPNPNSPEANKLRAKVLESSEAKLQGIEAVSDGQQAWAYVPAENKVYTGKLEELKALHPESESAIPTDPLAATEQLQKIVEQGLAAFNVELLGEEQVAGIDAYKVKISPKPDTQQQLQIQALVNATLWVDKERFLPLKLLVDAGSFGKAEVTARSIETNTGLADDLFTFTPPAGAEIINVAELMKNAQPRNVTLPEARAQVDFPLLEVPDEPRNARLVEVKLLGGAEHGTAVIQQYSGAGVEFGLIQSKGGMADKLGRGESEQQTSAREVTVRGVTGRLIEGQGRRALTMLAWEENGVHVSIAGKLTPDQALSIAEGLK